MQIGSTLTQFTPSQHRDLLKLATDSLAGLWTSGSVKGLIQRFAEALVRDFKVTSLASAILNRSPETMFLTPEPLGLEGVHPIEDALLARILQALRHTLGRDDEDQEGAFFLAVEGRTFAAAAMEMADAPSCFVIWEVTDRADHDHGVVLDLLVRAAQQEAKWYKRLDSTQTLIYRDDLTGLFNTRYLEIAIDAELKRAQRYKLPFSLLFIDLDGFKPINDQYGHLSGSAVLKQVALVIKDMVREIDIPMRYGGDEFVVLLVGATSETGLRVAERIRRRIAEEHFLLCDRGQVRLTCSIGVASFPDHGQDLASLIRVADENMYISKKSGKNRVSIVNRRLQENTR